MLRMGWPVTIILLLALAGLGAHRFLSGGREDMSGLALKLIVSVFLIIMIHYLGDLGAFSVMAVLPAVLLVAAYYTVFGGEHSLLDVRRARAELAVAAARVAVVVAMAAVKAAAADGDSGQCCKVWRRRQSGRSAPSRPWWVV